MAAIVVSQPSTAPPAASPAASEDLLARFTHFVAATQGVQSSYEVDKAFKTITSGSGGAEWLQGILDAQSTKELTSPLTSLSVGATPEDSSPAKATFILTDNRCEIQIRAYNPISRDGYTYLNGIYKPDFFPTEGVIEPVRGQEALQNAKWVVVNASPIATQIVFWSAEGGYVVGIYKGNGTAQKIGNAGSLTKWS